MGGRLREQGAWNRKEDDQTVQQLAAVPSSQSPAGRAPAGGAAFAMSDAEVSDQRVQGAAARDVCEAFIEAGQC